jgi:hypothetical protein
MVNFKVGDEVSLNGKQYSIVGTTARSFILEREGKRYKATAAKLEKIQRQDTHQQESRLARMVRIAQLFDKTIQYPTTPADCAVWFERLRCELSPENLACDGERSARQIAQARREIEACWRELEGIAGRKEDIY